MDQKDHWAYPHLRGPGLQRDQHLQHFKHEYLVYVRDFPVLLGRALGQVPHVPNVRHALAENIYEEQTGGLSQSAAHPELFLKMMRGMGFKDEQFVDDDKWLHPRAREYREFLISASSEAPWQAAVALLTIFLEGSVNERKELAGTFKRSYTEEAIREHALVKHYGCPVEAMELVRAHAKVEGGHRSDAWEMVLGNITSSSIETKVFETCQKGLVMWHRYRDGVAERMGLRPNAQAA